MTLQRKINGMIRLFRPELALSAGVCVAAGEIIALGSVPPIRELALGFFCGFCISGSALVLNDLFDLEVDRINAPGRPLPSGAVSPAGVIGLTVLATAAGLAASALISTAALILAVVFWFVGVLYNWRLKETGIWGNLMVSASVAVTFILGGVIAGDPWNKLIWVFSGMAFFLDLGEEIAGGAMDTAGDSRRNLRSVAIRWGKETALRISTGLFVLVVMISLIPAMMGWLGSIYGIMIAAMDIWILYHAVLLLRSRTPEEGHRYMRAIYLGAMIGIAAFIAGQFLV